MTSDDFFNNTYYTLTGPSIQETNPGQLTSGKIRLRAPDGFRWDTGGTAPVVTVNNPKAERIFVVFESRSTTEIVFNVTGTSAQQPPNNPHEIVFSNLRIGPAQGAPITSGQIRNIGSSAPGGTTNYGAVAMTVGADNRVRVETAANGSGTIVSSQNLQAGNSLTVYAIVRDRYNNFKRNDPATWSLVNGSGGISSGDLVPSGDNRSAVLTGELVGSANIRAAITGLSSVDSGLITVTHAPGEHLEITTQPSSTATAGTAFAQQPVLNIVDIYGNLATGNSFTQVTAGRQSGTGTLQGTTTVTANSGVVTFTNLSHQIANEIDIRFTAPTLGAATSQTIAVNPASANKLLFTEQPSSANIEAVITPPVEVQLYDIYDNLVEQSGTNVSLEKVSGSGTFYNSTTTVSTNSSGVAQFSNIAFDEADTYVVRAVSTGLTNTPDSNSFTIAEAGKLAGFRVELTNGDPIGTQTAGDLLQIQILAVDGAGETMDGDSGRDSFNGYVDLTTDGTFSSGTDTLSVGPFTDGVLATHDIILTESGMFRITATNAAVDSSESGASNQFVVDPAAPHPDYSTISATPQTMIANGSSQATVTVQLIDQFGNVHQENVSETILIFLESSAGGSLSSTTGNGDGTYTATLTASNDVGVEEIGASIDGTEITTGNPDVTYTFGILNKFLVEAAGGGSIGTRTAGSSFSIRITALDAFDNIVEDFDGSGNTVTITSTRTISSGGGTSPTFSNGVLTSHSITITQSGSATITARRTASSETGTSNSFTVNPGPASTVTSTITPNRNYLQNDGIDNTTVTVRLIDAFGNQLTSGIGNSAVTLSASGGSLSGVTNQNNGTYTATLTAGTSTVTSTVTGEINSSPMNQNAVVYISEFNRWTGQAGGSPSNAYDWSRTGNWSLGSLPTTDQIVLIPTELEDSSPITAFPVLGNENQNTVNPVLDFLVIESGANLTMNNRTLTINTELSGGGSIFADNSTFNLAGNVDLANFIAGSSEIYFNGSSLQSVEGDFTGNNIYIQNELEVHGYFESFSNITIETGNTLTMMSGSRLEAIGNLTIDGELIGTDSWFRIGGDINGSNITLTGTDVEFNGTSEQQVNGIDNIKTFTVNNPTTVVANNDLVVTDTLNIIQGTLTIASGFNLATNVTVGELSNIRMLRNIEAPQGYRLLSTPLSATYGNFLSGTITQGFTGASLAGDLQPNVLWYQESYEGTDLMRWRAPSGASNGMTVGRGYFVYFFGDIPEDENYNDSFPIELDVDGAENIGNGTEISLPVTYTAAADTGWNLVGNPYTATVNWDDGTWEKTNMSNSIYIWDESTNQYLTWNGATGSLGNGLIAPFQGFWVKANGQGTPSLKVRKNSKTTGATFYKTASPAASTNKDNEKEKIPTLGFEIRTEQRVRSTHFSFTDGGTKGIDDLDAYRLLPFETDTYLELYTVLDRGLQLAINNLPRKFGNPVEIKLHAASVVDGQFTTENVTLTWPEMNHIPDTWSLILIDRVNQKEINLREESFYDFTFREQDGPAPKKNTASSFKLLSNEHSGTTEPRFLLQIDPGDDAIELPDELVLFHNYPNPFRSSTTLRYGLPEEAEVRLDIFDLLGRRVQTLVHTRKAAGYHDVLFDAHSLASGTYFYRLVTPNKVLDKKMMLIK